MKGGSDGRISRSRCNFPLDQSEMNLSQLNVPNVAHRSAPLTSLNEMICLSTNDHIANMNAPVRPTTISIISQSY